VVLEGALRRPLLLQARAQGVSGACHLLTMESPYGCRMQPLYPRCFIHAKQGPQYKLVTLGSTLGHRLPISLGRARCRHAGTQDALPHSTGLQTLPCKDPPNLQPPPRSPAQAERAGLALLARLAARGRLHAALAALRGAFFLAAPKAQGFAAALVARLEAARLAAMCAPPAAAVGAAAAGGALARGGAPAAAQREAHPTLLGLSAADLQELLDDAVAEGGGCVPAGAGAAAAVGSRAAAASGIQGLGLTVTGMCPHALLHVTTPRI